MVRRGPCGKLFISTWTRFMRQWNSGTIPSSAVNPSLSHGEVVDPSCAPLPTKRGGFGVRSAMPAGRAERLCPNGRVPAPGFPALSRGLPPGARSFRRHTDLIQPLSLDEAYLDVSENKTGLPTATQVARTIREQIRTELNLTASAE